MDECTPEEALNHATSVPATEDVCVFIAPGAIVESSRPVEIVPVAPEEIQPPQIVPAAVLSEEVVPTEVLEASLVAHPLEFQTENSIAGTPTLTVNEARTAEEDEPLFATSAPETFPAPMFAAVSAASIPAQTPADASLQLPADTTVPSESGLSDWPIWQAAGAEEIETPPADAASVGSSARREIRRIPVFARRSSAHSDRVFWRFATVAAIFAIAALLLGAFSHRFSPLPRDLTEPTSDLKQVPFQKSRKPITPAVSQTKLPEAPPATTAKPQAESSTVAAASASAPVASKPNPQVRRRSSSNDDSDYVAKDTVTRYNKRPAVKHPANTGVYAEKKNGVKHYSDLK